MCGIISYFSNEKVAPLNIKRAVSQLISMDSLRGKDSTGLILEDKDGEVYTYKKAMNGHDFIQLAKTDDILHNLEDTRYLIAHNRAATKGSVTVNNAHPFQHGNITGVHNGTLGFGYTTLAKGTYPVDSEYVFAGINEQGSKATIKGMNGSFNLLWHDKSDDTIHLARNEDRPYALAKIKDKDIIIGASEIKMLEWILDRNGIETEKYIIPTEGYEYIFDTNNFSKPHMIKRELYVKPPSANRYNNTSKHNKKNNVSVLKTRHDTKGEKLLFKIVKFDPYKYRSASNIQRGTYEGITDNGRTVLINNQVQGTFKISEGNTLVYYTGKVRHVSVLREASGKETERSVMKENSVKAYSVKDPDVNKEATKQSGKKLLALVNKWNN